jgi:hypothetical protein
MILLQLSYLRDNLQNFYTLWKLVYKKVKPETETNESWDMKKRE